MRRRKADGNMIIVTSPKRTIVIIPDADSCKAKLVHFEKEENVTWCHMPNG